MTVCALFTTWWHSGALSGCCWHLFHNVFFVQHTADVTVTDDCYTPFLRWQLVVSQGVISSCSCNTALSTCCCTLNTSSHYTNIAEQLTHSTSHQHLSHSHHRHCTVQVLWGFSLPVTLCPQQTLTPQTANLAVKCRHYQSRCQSEVPAKNTPPPPSPTPSPNKQPSSLVKRYTAAGRLAD